MGYMKIHNLYKSQDILLFKRCYAMNKIHGTSAHISFKLDGNPQLHLFPGGEKYYNFAKIFNQEELINKFKEIGELEIVVFGEAYGGKCQGMSKQYGPNLRFVAFDVKIGDSWLTIPNAHEICNNLGLDFVDYVECDTELSTLDSIRDSDCPQAIRNGMGTGFKREGIVLRPLIEVRKNNGERIIAKYKRDDFKETKTSRHINNEELVVLTEAKQIADEWVTEMRITHVLDKIEGGADISKMSIILRAILDDIKREGEGEIIWSKEAEKAIQKAAAYIIKRRLQQITRE